MPPLMLRGAFTFAFLLAVAVTSSFAQTFVKGVVLDLEKKPVEGASITFEAQFHVDFDLTFGALPLDSDGKFRRQTKADSKGEFFFVGLPPGKYKIVARKDDAIDTVTIEIAGATPEVMKRVIEFNLRPEREATR